MKNNGLLQSALKVAEIFKDNKGRMSSKRTIAGAIVAIASTDAASKGELGWLHLGMCAVAGAIVLFAPLTEHKTKDEYTE